MPARIRFRCPQILASYFGLHPLAPGADMLKKRIRKRRTFWHALFAKCLASQILQVEVYSLSNQKISKKYPDISTPLVFETGQKSYESCVKSVAFDNHRTGPLVALHPKLDVCMFRWITLLIGTIVHGFELNSSKGRRFIVLNPL